MSKQVGLGFIGLGRIGTTHVGTVPNVREAKLVAVCDINEKRCEDIAQAFKVNAYTDYKELLRDHDVEAVFVLTDPSSHREIIENAAEMGKHVFCEKPIAPTLKDTDLILAAADAAKIKLQVGFNERFDPAKIDSKRLVEEGVVGRPLMMRATRDIPREVIELEWLLDEEKGGGPVVECAIHEIDLARWFFEDEVIRVYAEADAFLARSIDNASIILRFKKGGIAYISSSWTLPTGRQWETRQEIICSEGIIQMSSPPSKCVEIMGEKGIPSTYPLMMRQLGKRPIYYEPTKMPLSLDFLHYSPFGGSFFLQQQHFVRCILEDGTPKVSGRDGRDALEIALAALRSARLHKSVDLPLD